MHYQTWQRIWLQGPTARVSDRLINMGIFINREVEIKCKQKDNKGQIPDIVIQVKCKNESNVNIYVEVKGSWHKDVKSTMEHQLINKYMLGKTKYGVYLIGWYGIDGTIEINNKECYNSLNETHGT